MEPFQGGCGDEQEERERQRPPRGGSRANTARELCVLKLVNLFRAVRRKRGSLSKLDTADMRRQAPDQVQVSVPFSCTVPSCEDERSQLVRILVVYQLPQEESGTKHERQHLPEEGGGQRLRRACRAEVLRRRRRLPRRRRTATTMNTTRPISHVRLMPSSSLPAPSYPPPPASCAAPCNGRSCAVRGRADAAKAALQGVLSVGTPGASS